MSVPPNLNYGKSADRGRFQDAPGMPEGSRAAWRTVSLSGQLDVHRGRIDQAM